MGAAKRFETHPWNNVRIRLEVVDLGAGQTGLSPTCTVQRYDGQWLQSGGGWGGSPSSISLTAIDATNLPGLYGFTIGSSDVTAGAGGYDVCILESTFSVREYLQISVSGDANTAVDPDTLVAGSVADLVFQIAGLVGRHERIAWSNFNANNQPQTVQMKIYESAADAGADSNVKGTFDVTASYDGQGRLTSYVCVKS